MKKRIKNKLAKKQTPEVENNFGVEAGRWFSPDRNFPLWYSLDPKQEISNWQIELIWRRARALYANSPEIRNAVKNMVLLMGYILPLPNTRDKEFNEAARRVFMRRAMNPRLFETSGRLNFIQAQKYIEERAIIDGDVLTVLSKTRADNGGMVAFYSAPQVTGKKPSEENLRTGCIVGRSGRVQKYLLKDFTSEEVQEIPASRCVMYSHNPDPTDPRTVSELLTGICTAKDIDDVNRLHKQMVKLQALFGLIETKDLNDKRSGLNDLIQQRKGKGQACHAQEEQPLYIDGVKAISLEPGRKLETLNSHNPSNEVRAFVKDLIKNLAYAVGLDYEILYDINSLGSGAIRFALAKTQDWSKSRNFDRENWANIVYRHIIATEIEAGRLQPCKYAEETYDVTWVNRANWSIDIRHNAQAFIALYDKGLVDASEWTLATYGQTIEQIAEKRADQIAHLRSIAEKYNIPVEVLVPNAIGGTPLTWDEEEGTHECPEDTEPETVEEEEETTN